MDVKKNGKKKTEYGTRECWEELVKETNVKSDHDEEIKLVWMRRE